MNSPLLDTSIQRQIILLKLVHEMDNRPVFGDKFQGDPDSPVQLWLARVNALMSRVSIERQIGFTSNLRLTASYWTASINAAQIEVRKAIEDLQLELELYPGEEIGRVYSGGEEFKFFKDISEIIASAENEVFIIDPYLTASVYSAVFNGDEKCKIRVLCNKNAQEVAFAADKHRANGCDVVLRKNKSLHDRLVFVDRRICWLIGASIKDGGMKPTYITPLPSGLVEKKLTIYQELWSASSSVGTEL